MFGWDDCQKYHGDVYGDEPHHEGKFSHEAIAGAASFAAMKHYEDKQRAEGNPVDHQFAKEALVGLVGGEVDKLAETKGRDAWDRHEVKKHAQENAQRLYDDRYGGQPNFDPNYYN